MKIILILRPTINCKITINKHDFFIKASAQKRLLVSFDDAIYMQVFPFDDEFCFSPYIVMLSYSGKMIKSSSNQIQIIMHAPNVCDLIITPRQLPAYTLAQPQVKIFAAKSIAGITNECGDPTLIVNGNLLTYISESGKQSFFKIPHPPTSTCRYSVKASGQCLILVGKATQITSVSILNTQTLQFKSYLCHHYKIANDAVTLVTELCDYASHIKVTEITLSDSITKHQTYTAVTKAQKDITNHKIIPYAFMQDIKAENFTHARKFLDDAFSASLPNNALRDFFGKFTHITTPQVKTPDSTLCLTYKCNFNSFSSRYFKFDFNSNNKIQNICEVFIKDEVYKIF